MVVQYTELSDFQWEVIEDLFPEQSLCRLSLRNVINSIFWLLRTGTQWRNLDSKFPAWQAVYHHFRKWKLDGRFLAMNNRLIGIERYSEEREDMPSAVTSDSQSVKITALCSHDTGVDGNKKIKGRKRHIITDTMGLVLAVKVTAANAHDGQVGIKLFDAASPWLKRVKKVFVDGGYKGAFQEHVGAKLKAEVEISSRPASAKGFVPIKIRWVSERTFGWLNFFRRLSRDYEKTVESSESWIIMANCQIILSRMKN